MKTVDYPCEHGYYGLCTQCVREERNELRARVAELEARIAELQPMAQCAAIMAVCGYFSRLRRPDVWRRADAEIAGWMYHENVPRWLLDVEPAFEPLYAGSAPVQAEAKVVDADKGTCPACGTDIALTHAVNMLAAKAKGG